VDTPNGLFFSLDDTGILYSGHISNGLEISSQTIASQSNGDAFGAMTVDPVNHLVYVGIFGGAVNANDTSENEIYAVSYNPQNGALATPQYNTGTLTNTTTANTLISTASDPSFNAAVGLTLDQTTSKLYVTEVAFATYNDTYSGGSFLFPEKNEIDVISSTARNQTTQETLVSLPLQNLANGDVNPAYIGYIGGVAVDDATDKLYFTLNTSSNTGAIYYVSLDGGADQTPTKLNITGLNSNLTANGLKLDSSFSGYDDLTIDPATGQLYVASEVQTVSNPDSSVSITDPGEIYQFTLNGAGTGFNSASIFYQYGTATSAELPFGNQSNLDFVSLPVLTTTGSGTFATHNGAAVTLLAGAPNITDISGGGYIDSATVQILGGTNGTTVESGDVLSINGTTFTSTPTTFIDNGSIFDVSYSTTTNTLTITTLPNSLLLGDAQYAHILGEVRYTDNATSTATRTVTWQVNNGAPGTSSGTNETTTTANIDQAPTANPNTNTAVEFGTAATGNVTSNSTNPDSFTLTVSGFTGSTGTGTVGTLFHGTYGDLTLSTNGNYTYTAGATTLEQSVLASATTGLHPTEVITYTETDTLGDTSSSTLTITIDRPPTATPDTNSAIAGGSAAAGNVLTNDIDKDGDTITVTGFTDGGGGTLGTTFQGTYGNFTLNASGGYTYTAGATPGEVTEIANAATGSHPTEVITYTESDGHGGTASTTLSIAVDRAPVLTVSAGPVTYTALSTPISLPSAASITDPDGGNAIGSAKVTLTGGYAGDGDLLSVGGGTGTIVTADGSYNVVYSGAGTSETLTITTASGPGTLADYQQLLDEIDYSSTAADPTNAGANVHRSATFTVTDANGAVSAVAGPETIDVQLAPSISSVVPTTVGNITDLDATKVVTITVNFTSIVDVTGAPELQLNDNEVATYKGGTGTTALTFSYTVQPGDNTADLQVQSLLLNGGTIQDGNGHAAVLTNANNADLHLQVDTTSPTVSVAANQTALLAGQTSNVTFTFSESVPGFVLGDTTATGGTLGNLVHVGLNGSGQDIYTATFTPDATHTESGSVQVNAASYTDVDGNSGSASNTVDFTGNTLAPTASVAPLPPRCWWAIPRR
jgi:VCBS repeat-containing protein